MLEFYPTPLASTSALNHQGEGHAPSSAPSAAQFRQAVIDNDHPEQTATVKTESSVLETICAGCGRGISDRFLMRLSDRSYHEDCLVCAACGALLSHSCFTRDLKLYCRTDYERIYGIKCARCMEKISGSDLVLRVAGLVFHVECFVCCMCGQNLPRGAHYILRQGQPICRRDYEHDLFVNSSQENMERSYDIRYREAFLSNSSNQHHVVSTMVNIVRRLISFTHDDLMDENRPRDGRRGPKRPRTILTSAQRRQFKASFELSPKPCRKVREALAKDTGLSVRVVQVWFQNQRAKMKKLQRKAKTDPGSEKEPKEERRIESPHSDHSHYLNVLNMRDGESSSFPSATQPLNPNNPYSPEDTYAGNSGESFCSSDLSLDGTEAGYEIGDNESGAPDVHHGTSHFHGGSSSHESTSLSQSLHAAIHNPIDKLFMMQSSYFSGDHA